MGGDTRSCYASEDESSLEYEYPVFQSHSPRYYRDEDESVSGSDGYVSRGFDEVGHWVSSTPVEFDGNLRRRKSAYKEIMKNYDDLWVRRESLYQAKSKILSYTPGSWISNVGGKKRSNYVVPKTTTLLLIGPKGSGKSSLVNRISRVFEDDKFASERAQVTYNSSSGEGTYFIQEYMIPRSSTSFCLFDTRSLSEIFVVNDEMLQRWMRKGVRHGELVIRDSDNSSLKMALKCKAQQSGSPSSEIRKVNFVIFAVNGFSVLRAMNSDKEEDKRYMEMVTKTFSSPYLSFKDDKPVVVVTHGDLLSLGDRARVRVYLGEKLGVPPVKQIFDIPDNSDPSTELTILDMIRYSLEHADKNLPCKESTEWIDRRTFFDDDGVNNKVFRTSILTFMFLAILAGIACVAFPIRQSQKHDEPLLTSSINWHSKAEARQLYESATAFSSNPRSNSVVNHYQEERRHENQESRDTSAPTLPSKTNFVVNHSQEEQGHENQEHHDTSAPTLPSKPVMATATSTLPKISVVPTSEPTLHPESDITTSAPIFTRSKHAVQRPCKEAGSRSPSPSPPSSPEHRHPKSAVKWHKIRHLWLDSESD